jgi:hypothetical protein
MVGKWASGQVGVTRHASQDLQDGEGEEEEIENTSRCRH